MTEEKNSSATSANVATINILIAFYLQRKVDTETS
jgi:hypothetical protein